MVEGFVLTGSPVYCATVIPPIPVASADTAVFVAESVLVTLPVVPVWVDELPVSEAVDVLGGVGGVVGGVTGGVVGGRTGGAEVQLTRMHHGL